MMNVVWRMVTVLRILTASTLEDAGNVSVIMDIGKSTELAMVCII